MSRFERSLFLVTSSIVFITGGIYFIYKYYLSIETSFGVRPHPFTSSLLHLHIILVPVLVLFFGYFFKIHILEKLNSDNKNRKRSGIFTLVTLVVMIFSGYYLQTGTILSVNQFTAWVHIIISFLWFIVFIWHFRVFKRK